MKEDLINEILMAMMPILDEEQLGQLKLQLFMKFTAYNIEEKKTALAVYDDSDFEMMNRFLAAKASARKSPGTLRNYSEHIRLMIEGVGKRIKDIDADDISLFLYNYQVRKGISKTTARNIRASLSSFFSWLRKTGRIEKNPIDLVEVIKVDSRIKEVFSDEDIIKIREKCDNKRDLALIDFLNSSMVRVAELVRLNRSDIQFGERECIVFGKGSKERIAYFDGNAKIHLESYLEERKDDNPALFVGLKPINGKFERLTISGVQDAVRRIGKKLGIRVHPHKFRRSGATRNLEKGMELYDLKDLLGHTKVETTLIYARKRRKLIKMSYERFNM